jgi:hypothetical protein
MPMLAIPDQGVDMSICDPRVLALLVGTGEALCVHPDGALPGGFSSHAKVAQAKVQAPQQTSGRRRGYSRGNRVGCVA